MRRYAERTEIPPEKSRADIEKLLVAAGATRFAAGWEKGRASVAFELRGRAVRFILPLPDVTRDGRSGPAINRDARQRWRALLLLVKAKLEAVASGITTIEEEFLAHTVLPDGETVYARIRPTLLEHFQGGQPVQMLLPPPAQGPST
jgi:hypothetical protein